jgi:hypothetical protein
MSKNNGVINILEVGDTTCDELMMWKKIEYAHDIALCNF